MLLTVHGLELNVERQGHGPPLLLLHGFTGSAETWLPLLPELARAYAVYAVDLVGHGRSGAPEGLEHYRMNAVVADLAALLDRLGLPNVALLGYSMGGRTALQFAVAHPERVRALILESASPGIADAVERNTRVRSDEALAQRIKRDGVPAFVGEWERLPLFRSQERLPAAVQERQRQLRLRNWPHGLANSLRGMGAGAQGPVWSALPDLAMPVLLIVGEDDSKYGAIARQMADALPRATVATVPEAGHAVHLEQPEVFASHVVEFLRGVAGNSEDQKR